MTQNAKQSVAEFSCETPEDTFELGESLGAKLSGGEVILLKGTLGAGKTLLTKGIVSSLEYDSDEVTSPSFTLVNLYEGKFDIFHLDLWRLDENSDAAFAVGLDEILDNPKAVVIIEWAEKLKNYEFPGKVISVELEGDGDSARRISITEIN